MIEVATITFHNGKSRTRAGKGYRGYHTKASMKSTLAYIMRDDKTSLELKSGIHCSPDSAYKEMLLIKELYGKDEEDGKNRFIIHFSQNFSEGEAAPEIVHKIAKELLDMPMFDGFQVAYATHTDTGKYHTHFVINTVNMDTGEKWQMSEKQLQELKDYSDSLCQKYGLSVVQHMQGEKNRETYKSQLQLKTEQEGKSWKKETYLTVKACLEAATSREEFIELMKSMGYGVAWSEQRTYVTFTDPDGHKIRNKKLYPRSAYTKEAMEERFALNKQYAKLLKERDDKQMWNDTLGAASGMLRIVKSMQAGGERYPMQHIQKNYSSKAARMEMAKEEQKGRGIDWENEG